MSVRFASTNHPGRRLGWRAAGRGLIAPALARAANDNGTPRADGSEVPGPFEPLLIDALHHFAVHGLAAASAALEQAGDAAAHGDADARDHWLAVTRMFDRRLAPRAPSDLAPS
ncbi:hypothetical protein [Erythrobacter donghaensis]|uniref:hypothetical protein n=1 Tax=Erythrobacter donghaensis TaxID=267135 RepID=UPI000A3916CC|nr:hypothetical protein [Erythrobacter donghaensis]